MLLVSYNWLSLIRIVEDRGVRPDLSRLRMAYSVGARLTDADRERIDCFLAACRAPCRITTLFDLSETNSILACESAGKDGWYYRLLDGVQVMCLSEQTRKPLGPGQRGRLLFRTPCMFRNYLLAPNLTQKALFEDADGRNWFDTEDIGYLTEDGGFVIEGRAADLFRSGDKSVYVFEIKKLLEASHRVRACEVYFNRSRDELRAYVVPEDEDLIPREGSEETCRKRQEETAAMLDMSLVFSGRIGLFPSKYCFLQDIPLAKSGKPDNVIEVLFATSYGYMITGKYKKPRITILKKSEICYFRSFADTFFNRGIIHEQ